MDEILKLHPRGFMYIPLSVVKCNIGTCMFGDACKREQKCLGGGPR